MPGIKKVTYYFCLLGICFLMVLALGLGMSLNSPIIISLVVIISILVAYAFYKRINEVMTDSLSEIISGKAAIRTLEIVTVLAAILFALTMTFYFGSGGLGTGMHTYENGSARIGFMVFYPTANPIYHENVFIQDMSDISGDELMSIEHLIGFGYRVRDAPLFMGLAFGIITILIAGFFAAFSYYYDKKYET